MLREPDRRVEQGLQSSADWRKSWRRAYQWVDLAWPLSPDAGRFHFVRHVDPGFLRLSEFDLRIRQTDLTVLTYL